MTQKTGALIFDETADRYDIRFDVNDYYGGLHCGDCMEVFVRGKWKPTRMEYGDNWYLVGIRAADLSGLRVEKEIKIEKEREGETGHPAPAAYGRYNNVILTDTELSGLKTELPDKWEYYIDRLSCHIASTGKQYHSHAATIYKWAQEDAAKGKAAPKQGIPDYSCKEGESL